MDTVDLLTERRFRREHFIARLAADRRVSVSFEAQFERTRVGILAAQSCVSRRLPAVTA